MADACSIHQESLIFASMGKTIGKAFTVLEALTERRGTHRVSDVAQRVGLSEPSTCRLLGSLVELGYAERDEDSGGYIATLKLWEIAQRLIGGTDELQEIAQPILASLSSATAESSSLGVFDDGYCIYIAKAEGSRAIRAVATVGSRQPATAVAFGKAILAWRPDLVPQALARAQRFTRHTLTTARELERDLAESRSRGYAVSRGELHTDVCAIGCPVFDAAGRAVAGVALWGSRDSILGERMDEMARETMFAAQRISARLGYVETIDEPPHAGARRRKAA
jgi:IclR family acetate operon transcriptional repressor